MSAEVNVSKKTLKPFDKKKQKRRRLKPTISYKHSIRAAKKATNITEKP